MASQYAFARRFPHLHIDSVCSSVHESRSTDFTRVTCVPSDLWTPEQRMQIKRPRFHDAQRGLRDVLQSAQCLFAGSCKSCRRRSLFFAVVACDLLNDIAGCVSGK